MTFEFRVEPANESSPSKKSLLKAALSLDTGYFATPKFFKNAS